MRSQSGGSMASVALSAMSNARVPPVAMSNAEVFVYTGPVENDAPQDVFGLIPPSRRSPLLNFTDATS